MLLNSLDIVCLILYYLIGGVVILGSVAIIGLVVWNWLSDGGKEGPE